MMERMLQHIGAHFPLTEEPCGDYAKMKVSSMTFRIRKYDAKGLGLVSVMEASGFFGLMKMDTLIINPTAVDMPLLSYDRVHAMGNDTLIFELYDTQVLGADLSPLDEVKSAAGALPDHDLGQHWYDSIKLSQSLSKKGKKAQTPAFNDCAERYLKAFLTAAAAAPNCPAEEKRKKAAVYVDGLLTHGGPSTDVFKKGIGEEKTAALFRNVLFGTAK